jgi:hypothetical protein
VRSPTRRCSPTSLAGSQAQVLQPLVVLVQQHDLVDGHLLVSIGDDHELQREAQRYTGDSKRRKIHPPYPPLMPSRNLAPPLCHALLGEQTDRS